MGTEALWLKTIGVLLIAVGLVLFVSPRIMYSARERIIHTNSVDVTAKRQETLAIPRSLALLTIAAGIAVIVVGARKPQ
jgi:uncharacterized membrane protein YfcA